MTRPIVRCVVSVWSGPDLRAIIRRNNDREVDLHEALGYTHSQLAQALGRTRRLLRSERGQGTVEYVALVLLVALVMLGVVTAMRTYKFGEGQELGDLIVKKISDAVSKVRY